MKSNQMKNKIILLVQGFLISLACTIRMQSPLNRSDYEETIDYLLAQVTVFLGDYNILSVFIFVMDICFPVFLPFGFIWGEAIRKPAAGNIALAALLILEDFYWHLQA